MSNHLTRCAHWLKARSENLSAAFMAVMFLAFLYQVLMRYVFGQSISWVEEVCVMSWVWAVLWGTAFVTDASDDVRIDLLHGSVPRRVRRVFEALSSLALVVVFLIGLPGAWSYVTFMKIETTAALSWRFHLVFSIYILFAVAVIARQAIVFWQAVIDADAPHATTIGSAS